MAPSPPASGDAAALAALLPQLFDADNARRGAAERKLRAGLRHPSASPALAAVAAADPAPTVRQMAYVLLRRRAGKHYPKLPPEVRACACREPPPGAATHPRRRTAH